MINEDNDLVLFLSLVALFGTPVLTVFLAVRWIFF